MQDADSRTECQCLGEQLRSGPIDETFLCDEANDIAIHQAEDVIVPFGAREFFGLADERTKSIPLAGASDHRTDPAVFGGEHPIGTIGVSVSLVRKERIDV